MRVMSSEKMMNVVISFKYILMHDFVAQPGWKMFVHLQFPVTSGQYCTCLPLPSQIITSTLHISNWKLSNLILEGLEHPLPGLYHEVMSPIVPIMLMKPKYQQSLLQSLSSFLQMGLSYPHF